MSEIDKGDAGPGRGQRSDDIAGPLLTGIAVGAVLVGLVWWVVAMATSSPDEPASSRAGDDEIGAPLAAPAATQPAAPSRMDRCVDAAYALTRPLLQARPAMDQWAVHVGAMNKLVVGEITLAQATAFWNQTRVGAHHRIRTFDRAMTSVARDGVDCPRPPLLGTGAGADVRACSAKVAAEIRTLDLARTAITTWRHHVDAMDQLRLGKLSPTAATQMWLSMWQRGVQELDAYRAAAKAERLVAGCGGDVGAAPSAVPSETPSPTHSMSSMH
jgi:hypothetical protein